MKLLFVSNLFPDTAESYRGLDNACLLHEMSKRCDVRVVSPRPTLPLKSFHTIPRDIDVRFQPQYVPAYYVPKLGSTFNHRLMASALRQPLRQVQKQFRFDAILCSWLFPDAAAIAMLQDEFKVPFVAIAQGSDVHSYLRIAKRREIIVNMARRSSGIITRSAKLAELLGEAGVAKEKLHPVYNGVDLELFRPGDKSAVRKQFNLPVEPIIVFVGNFLLVKNPLLLVRAHAALCRERQSTLVMIGGGPMEQEVRQAADAAGFGSRVILAGRKKAAEIADYMRAADVLCMSSENEGVPNVILEAFASGLPVVSTNVGGISEVLNKPHLGRLVERGNAEQLTAALLKTLSESPQTQAIREHGLRFSWERAADQYFAVLKQAMIARPN